MVENDNCTADTVSGYDASTTYLFIGGACISVFYFSYTLTFFALLWSALGALSFYNLLAMFGLDEDIGNFSRALLGWFTTPPTDAQKEEMGMA